MAISHFFSYRDRIEQEIAKSIVGFGEKTKLRDACEYALTNGGKRFRPLIVLLIGEGLGFELPLYEAALSVEFFHTASLIVDDLPCMDNEEERRSKPTLHKVYGETIALLASFALITAAFEKIYQNGVSMSQTRAPFCHGSDRACMIALESASKCSGILGATGGQFWDLFPHGHSLEFFKQLIYKKTVTLFEVSFIYGWVFGGGDFVRLPLVKEMAYHLGMAFQIADDIADLFQDEAKQREMNIARFLGKERAFQVFEEEMGELEKKLRVAGLYTPSFQKMCEILLSNALSVAR